MQTQISKKEKTERTSHRQNNKILMLIKLILLEEENDGVSTYLFVKHPNIRVASHCV